MAYRDRMRKALTGRAGDWLARNSCPRIVVLVSYLLGAALAFPASVSLKVSGVESMPVRFAISFLVGYVFYSVLLSVWLRFVPTLDKNALMKGSNGIQTIGPHEEAINWGDSRSETLHTNPDLIKSTVNSLQREVIRQPKAIVALPLLVAILGIVFLMAYWLFHARWYLGDLLIRAGRIRHKSLPKPPREAWLIQPYCQSIWMAIALLAHFVLLGMVLQIKIA